MVRDILKRLLRAVAIAAVAMLLMYGVLMLAGCDPSEWVEAWQIGQHVPPIPPANTPTAMATR